MNEKTTKPNYLFISYLKLLGIAVIVPKISDIPPTIIIIFRVDFLSGRHDWWPTECLFILIFDHFGDSGTFQAICQSVIWCEFYWEAEQSTPKKWRIQIYLLISQWTDHRYSIRPNETHQNENEWNDLFNEINQKPLCIVYVHEIKYSDFARDPRSTPSFTYERLICNWEWIESKNKPVLTVPLSSLRFFFFQE